jgi:oligopeptide transport system ATP-binding protein
MTDSLLSMGPDRPISACRGVMRAVDGVSLDVAPGEVLGIVGESGSGKSQILLRDDGAAGGERAGLGAGAVPGPGPAGAVPARLDRVRGHALSMIFQDPMTSLNPYMRVGDQLAEGLIVHKGLSRHRRGPRRCGCWTACASRCRRPRAALPARVFGRDAAAGDDRDGAAGASRLLLADEPTTALDVTIQAQVLDLMAELARETGTAIILVTHDLGVVARLCDRVVVLYGGRVMEEAPAEALFDAPRIPIPRGCWRRCRGWKPR